MSMNLLEYVRTPAKYEIKIKHATLQVQQNQVKVQTQTTPAQLEMRQRQVKVRTDTVELRSSMGLKNMPDFMNDAARRGSEAAMRAVRDYAEFGNNIKNIQKGANIPDALFARQMERAQGSLMLVPLSPTDISWIPGGVEAQYTPAEVQNSFVQGNTQMQFVPGSFSFEMVQYPQINFNFLGGFLYVPPSAAPDVQ